MRTEGSWASANALTTDAGGVQERAGVPKAAPRVGQGPVVAQ